jgi:hypothetical protein
MDLIKLFAGGFPATIETIAFLQDAYTKPLKALSNLAGDNVILEGIATSGGTVSEGWFVRNGEPVYFKSSPTGATVRVIDKTIKVPYNEDIDGDGDLDLKDAYVSRFATTNVVALAPDEVLVYSFPFADLTKVSNFRYLQPVGSAILWFDAINIPAGYRVMDGTGDTIVTPFGTAEPHDLRNKFIKMAGSEGAVNTGGGSKTATLVAGNLPAHTHSVASQSVTRRFGTGGANSDGGDDYLRTTDADGVGSNKAYTIPAHNTDNGTGLTATPFDIEPVHYFAIWIQYIGL